MFNTISSSNGLILTTLYQSMTFKTDIGSLLQDFDVKEVPMIAQVKTMYSFDETEIVASLRIQGYKYGDIYIRTYSKLQDVLTRMGGLINGLMIIGFVINYMFSNSLYVIESYLNDHRFLKPVEILLPAASQVNLRVGEKVNRVSADEKPYIISKPNLFCIFWCKSQNKRVNSTLEKHKRMIGVSLNVQTLMRHNFDVELFKCLLFSKEQLGSIDKLYQNIYESNNSYMQTFREKMYGKRNIIVFERAENNKDEKLKLMSE